MSNHDELIAQFIEISGGDENVARFYLASSNWSLEDALSNFLGNQVDGDEGNVEPPPRRNSGGASNDDDTSRLPTASGGTGSQTEANTPESFTRRAGERPRFATLTDMTKRTPNEEEGQAFYAGGSERSGQQVLGPPKRKNFREQLTDMFRMAQEQSGEAATSVMPSTSGGVSWGQGVRLGMTDSDHTVIKPQEGSTDNDEKKPVVVLKLWSQGFSIDDGELRLYDDPENKEFLETVMRGEIPNELLEMGWMVNVDVEDHRHEDYKKKSSVARFRGSGHTLGSPVPNVENAAAPSTATQTPAAAIAAAAAAAAAVATDTKGTDEVAKEKLHINAAQPTTTLQIRLADGSRLMAQFNLTHTVGDVHQYIQNARPQYANGNFRLVSSFPTRELTDEGATLEGAGLKNAAILQRLN